MGRSAKMATLDEKIIAEWAEERRKVSLVLPRVVGKSGLLGGCALCGDTVLVEISISSPPQYINRINAPGLYTGK